MDLSPEGYIAMQVRRVLAEERRKSGDGRLGICISASPLMVRLHGDSVDTPAKQAGDVAPAAADPVLCFRAGGRLYALPVEGV